MAERPDLRQISGNIREALADFDREALLEVLTYVFKEYVVEGPPPLLVSEHEKLEDLEGLSFAQLISSLQTRLQHPELALFQVEGQTVTVRGTDGSRTPLVAENPARRGANTGDASVATDAAGASAAAAMPGVQFVDTRGDAAAAPRDSVQEAQTRGRGDLAGGQRSAPRPVAGLSVSGRRAAGMMDATEQTEAERNAAQRGAATPAAPAARAASNKDDEKKPEEPPAGGGADDDDASIRFSLLELE